MVLAQLAKGILVGAAAAEDIGRAVVVETCPRVRHGFLALIATEDPGTVVTPGLTLCVEVAMEGGIAMGGPE